MAEESEVATAATPINGNTPTSRDIYYTVSIPTQNSGKRLVKSKLYIPTISTPTESEGVKKTFHCTVEGCNKTYGKGSLLLSHMKWHSGEKPYVCEEPSCTKRFTRSVELARHYRNHSGEKPYECEQCKKKFKRSDHLTKHLSVHLKETKVEVKQEEDSSSDANGLESNDSSSSFICPPSLAVSVKQEIDEEDYEFSHKTKEAVSEIKIEPETMTETSIPAFMPIDPSHTMSYAIQQLPRPIKLIREEPPPVPRPFVCPKEECKKTFRKREELRRHSKIHTGIKPYSCKQCGKKFLRGDYLKKHLGTHTRITKKKGAKAK